MKKKRKGLRGLFIHCGMCDRVMKANEEKQDDVCPRCGASCCLSARFDRKNLPDEVTSDMMEDIQCQQPKSE
jgi:hypothetical protein